MIIAIIAILSSRCFPYSWGLFNCNPTERAWDPNFNVVLIFLQIRESLTLQRCGLTGTAVAFKAATLGACCAWCDDEEDTALFSNLFICTSLLQLYLVPYPSGFSDTALDYIDLNCLKISLCLMLLQVQSKYKQA